MEETTPVAYDLFQRVIDRVLEQSKSELVAQGKSASEVESKLAELKAVCLIPLFVG